jgi:hypothetical protein
VRRVKTPAPPKLIGTHEGQKRHSYSAAGKSLGQGSHIAQNAATHIKSTMKRYK